MAKDEWLSLEQIADEISLPIRTLYATLARRWATRLQDRQARPGEARGPRQMARGAGRPEAGRPVIHCDHIDPSTCPSWECRAVLPALGIETPPSRRSSAISRRIDAAWRLEPLPGRLVSAGLRGRGDLAAAR